MCLSTVIRMRGLINVMGVIEMAKGNLRNCMLSAVQRSLMHSALKVPH